MPGYEDTRTLDCPARHIYDVVMDIEAYPSFLPWVTEARVLERIDRELKAELVADFAGIRHGFKTIDRFIPGKLVEIRLLEGPFRHLESVWSFERIDDERCRVHFSIEFEFRNLMLALVASPVFGHACMTMAHVFEKRAIALYRGNNR